MIHLMGDINLYFWSYLIQLAPTYFFSPTSNLKNDCGNDKGQQGKKQEQTDHFLISLQKRRKNCTNVRQTKKFACFSC